MILQKKQQLIASNIDYELDRQQWYSFIREMWPCKNVCMCYDDKICTLADVMTRDQVFAVLEEGDVDHKL